MLVPVIQLLVLIGLVWLIIWAIKTLIPIEAAGQKALTVVGVVVTVLLVLYAFGLMPLNVPRLR